MFGDGKQVRDLLWVGDLTDLYVSLWKQAAAVSGEPFSAISLQGSFRDYAPNGGNFRVYEQPIESPQHTTPLPPADARSLQLSPEDATASPNGRACGASDLCDHALWAS